MPLSAVTPVTRTKQEIFRERLNQSVRTRNCLIIEQKDARQKDAKQRSCELLQHLNDFSFQGNDQKRPRRSALPDHRAQLLNRSREITVELREWEKTFKSQLVAYGQAMCLPFAEEMQARLPIEIRDMIYQYMLDGVSKDYLRSLNVRLTHDRQPKKMWYYESPVFPWIYPGTRTPRHWEDSDYVGLKFAKEMITTYYRVCTFIIREPSFHLLDTFLQQEPCGYGILISDIISHLEMIIAFKRYIGWDENRNYKVKFDETKEQTAKQKETLSKQLQALLRIEGRCTIDFKIEIWHGDGKAGILQFGEMVDMLLPIISVLKNRGSTININFMSSTLAGFGAALNFGKWVIQDTASDPIVPFLRNVMDKFGLPGVENVNAEDVRAFEANFIPPNPDDQSKHYAYSM
ncbi:hypothetical protein K504DRAFT_533796 [Pleomassaria siparia CBS 279.74]|uniref:Uncharacterized protein n=1 Tax=Pleomassaria siparia CBS 279.74 TaxID=1314801 RepID=A0A6G1K9X1_9PLEO|nr:hypothetical protein K504DRAFT_533796 [Pleomassaria siparia CBS 279.74]